MEERLTISGLGITAYARKETEYADTDWLLEESSGIFETPSINIETADKMYEAGEYLISKSVGGREITIKINRTFPDEATAGTGVTNFLQSIDTLAIDLTQVNLVYYRGSTALKTWSGAYITGYSLEGRSGVTGRNVSVSITFKSLNP